VDCSTGFWAVSKVKYWLIWRGTVLALAKH
jgi:hypothetical protein